MRKKKKYHKFIFLFLFFILFVFLFYYFINDKEKNNFILYNLKDLSASISKVTIKQNNNINKEISKEINKDYQREIKELKNSLELNKINSDKKLVNAIVIKRSSNYWYNLITINKGKKDGIKEGYAVINNYGLVGKIIKVNKYSSDIKLLISYNKENYVSAYFNYNNNSYYGLISNYNILKNELTLKNVVGDFNKEKLIGLNVSTSGLSDSFSSGLLIGKINNVKKDNFGISNIITITPAVDFNNINIVSIVIGDK